MSVLLMVLTITASAAEPGFAFGVNGDDFSLSTYRVMADGRLRHMGHRPVNKAPPMVAVHPSGRFVAVVSSTVDTLEIFRLDPISGELTPVPGSPFATHAMSPFSVSFHPSGRFVYLGARFSGVAAFAFDENSGVVTSVPGSPFPAQQRTRMAVVHPSGKFLYAVNAYSNSVSAYVINQQTGALSELPDSPYSVGDMGVIDYLSQRMLDVPPEAGGIPHFVDVDPQGRFVFVPNRAAASVSVFAVDPRQGSLHAVAGSPFFVGFNPYRSRVHPSGNFVLTTLWADGKVAVHAIDNRNGRLTPVAGSPFSVESETPVDLTFNDDGSQVYVSNFDGNEITLLNMDVSSGKLSLQESLMTRLGPWSLALAPGETSKQPVQQVLYVSGGTVGLARIEETQTKFVESVKGHGDALALAPDGRFAYALDTIEGSISSYAIGAGQGNMMPVPNGVVKTGKQPTDMKIDVNGWYLYVTNTGDDSLSVYYLNPKNGIPEPVRGSPMRAGKHPVGITLDAAARYAFVVNAGSDNVSVYRYLTNVTPLIFESNKYGSPFATGKEPMALAIEPTGHYAYVANAGSNDISAYHIHHKTGAMAEMPGSPFKAGQHPVDLQVHPGGQWLYVANQDSSTLTVHRIEAGLGALANEVMTIALSEKPEALWMNETGSQLFVLAEKGHRLLRYALNVDNGNLRLQSEQYFSEAINDLAVFSQPAAIQ